MADVRKLLVIGSNHKEIAAKYSTALTTEEKRVKYKITEAPKLHVQYLKTVEEIIKTLQDNPNIPRQKEQIDEYIDIHKRYSAMDDFEFYHTLTEEYEHDENGDTITDENPNAHYQYEECYDERIRKNQMNEAPFADPLILKNGMKVYSAKVGDIDWDIVHLGKSDIYRAVWEICVDGREPINDDEKTAKMVMSNKKDYFASFNNVDEYIGHNCAFWCYGVATEDEYVECNGRDIDWTNGFYDRFIKPLPNDTVISVYQMRLLD